MKMKVERGWTDRRIENVLGNLLRIGVGLSAFIVFCGGAIYLARHGKEPTEYQAFRGEPASLRNVPGIVREALSSDARAIIQLGLLFLIATPVARVIFAIWGFAAERDRMYVIFTVIVLVILIFSLVGLTRI
jgi:uncharacterized membrane protein